MALTSQSDDASDLTQETFYIWATKGGLLRDQGKAKSWLFTTLYRLHLNSRRRQSRFPHHELTAVDIDLPVIEPAVVQQMDAASILQALSRVDELYRAPLAMFYLEEHSYADIAEILEVPIGTVMSRLARGKALLRRMLAAEASQSRSNIVPFDKGQGRGTSRKTL